MMTTPTATRADVYLRIAGRWTLERANCPTRTAYDVRADLLESGHPADAIRIVAAGLTVDGALA